MKIKTIGTSIFISLIPLTGSYAAALDRSGQSISSFLQPNNYFEAGISIISPDVKGKEADTSATRRDINDIGEDYYFPNAAIKLQLTDNLSFGLIYDQPFGAKVKYTGDNILVSNPTDTILSPLATAGLIEQTFAGLTTQQRVGLVLQQKGVNLASPEGQAALKQNIDLYNSNPNVKEQIDSGVKAGVKAQVDTALATANKTLGQGETYADVKTQNLSFIFGFQPISQLNLYAGGVYQTVKGDVQLRGQATSIFNGYTANFDETSGIGWLAGAAFQIPEIALKASLTYRSKIDHDVNTIETLSTTPALALLEKDPVKATALVKAVTEAQGDTKIKTPQSVNFDFQSGIMKDTIAFANVRWVNWKDFAIRPVKFGLVSQAAGPLVNRPNGFNIIKYSDDQWSANVGVGRKISDQWAGNISAGWDSGTGELISALGPTKGYWNIGLGTQFSPTPATFIAAGIKYFWLGDAKGQVSSQTDGPDYIAEFKDNNALAYGLKMGYRF